MILRVLNAIHGTRPNAASRRLPSMEKVELDHRPIFDSVDEMVRHFAGGAAVRGICGAKVKDALFSFRAMIGTVFILGLIAAAEEISSRLFAHVLVSALTEFGLGLFFLGLFGYILYRLFRPDVDILALTEEGVLALRNVRETVHGVSAEWLFRIPAEDIGRFRFTKLSFPVAVLHIQVPDKDKTTLVAVQNRLQRKRHLVGEAGSALRDMFGLLRSLAYSGEDKRWGREGSMVPIYAKAYGAFVLIIVLLVGGLTGGVVGLGAVMADEGAEKAERGVEAYEAGDYAIAWTYFEEAAEDGNALAQAYLGGLSEAGNGTIPVDTAEAVRWYAKAAEQGNAMAQAGLGALLISGSSEVPSDTAAARHWLTLAAAAEEPRGINGLGHLEWRADRHTEAVSLFRRAAAAGSVKAYANLGLAYYEGNGVPRDYGESLSWYQRAANEGLPEAQIMVGYMLDRGLGTAPDDEGALHWYRTAASNGHTDAADYAETLEAKRPYRDAVRGLRFGTRPSLLEDGSVVLQLRNPARVLLNLSLDCRKPDGYRKELSVAIAPGAMEEVGFMEGWPGNFRVGHACTIEYDGVALNQVEIRTR